MKKIILIGLLLLTSACSSPLGQTATPTLEPTLNPTATLPPSPTPVSATNTPEVTPTLEPTPTPLPRFFNTQFDSSLTGWVILQAGNVATPNVEVRDTTLRLQMDTPYTWMYALYGTQDYAEAHVETEFINSALSPASIGLVCHYSDTGGWVEYNVTTDGTYNLLYGQWLDTGIADYLPITDGSSKEIKQSGEVQQIGLTCSGTTAQLFVNGTIIRSLDISRYELTEGKVGLTASSFENTPVIAVFNYFSVSGP